GRELPEGGDQLLLGGGDVVVEQHVSDRPREVDRLYVLHRRRRDVRGDHRDGARRRSSEIENRERVRAAGRGREQPRVQLVDARAVGGVHHVRPVDGQDLRAASEVGGGRRRR